MLYHSLPLPTLLELINQTTSRRGTLAVECLCFGCVYSSETSRARRFRRSQVYMAFDYMSSRGLSPYTGGICKPPTNDRACLPVAACSESPTYTALLFGRKETSWVARLAGSRAHKEQCIL